jgi:hypothetical protein
MRLTPQQREGIITAIHPFIKNNLAELRLYGSRVHDHLKGGDIDLVLIIADPACTTCLQQKHHMLAAMKKEIGEQKIDFKIATPAECQEDSFLKIILPASLILHQWG